MKLKKKNLGYFSVLQSSISNMIFGIIKINKIQKFGLLFSVLQSSICNMIFGIIKILQKFQKFGLFLSNEFQTISEEFLKNFLKNF